MKSSLTICLFGLLLSLVATNSYAGNPSAGAHVCACNENQICNPFRDANDMLQCNCSENIHQPRGIVNVLDTRKPKLKRESKK
jgi:hypothetical protein